MDWKSFYQLKVERLSEGKISPYFQSELKVPEEFSLDELNIRQFDHLNLTAKEIRSITLAQRKIILRHNYFNGKEFERISSNFIQRLMDEKDSDLRFTTKGGGIYLFLSLLKQHPPGWNKKILCQTSEIPLPVMRIESQENPCLKLIYRPELVSCFDRLPSLWDKSPLMALFEVEDQDSEAA